MIDYTEELRRITIVVSVDGARVVLHSVHLY